MNRLDARFAQLKAKGRAAFVAYIMTGDPDIARSEAILAGLPAAGADVIELGFPFSDPMAEGPVIQLASQRALAAGTTLTKTLGVVSRFRQGEAETPIVLMGYLNPILSYGYARFAADSAAAGIDGLIVVDCPPEEADELCDALEANGIALIRLTAPTTDDARLQVVARRTAGFIYYVAVAGVTGVKEAVAADAAPAVERIRKATGLPVAVGFGIRTPERAAEIARIADAAVVGSALVEVIARAERSGQDPVSGVLGLVSELSAAVRGARIREQA